MGIAQSLAFGRPTGLPSGVQPVKINLGSAAAGLHFQSFITTLDAEIIRILNVRFDIVCDANVANRRPVVDFAAGPSAAIIYKTGIVGTPFMLANNTYRCCLSTRNGTVERFVQDPATATLFDVTMPLGDVILSNHTGSYIRIQLNGIAAGDQIQNVIVNGWRLRL